MFTYVNSYFVENLSHEKMAGTDAAARFLASNHVARRGRLKNSKERE